MFSSPVRVRRASPSTVQVADREARADRAADAGTSRVTGEDVQVWYRLADATARRELDQQAAGER